MWGIDSTKVSGCWKLEKLPHGFILARNGSMVHAVELHPNENMEPPAGARHHSWELSNSSSFEFHSSQPRPRLFHDLRCVMSDVGVYCHTGGFRIAGELSDVGRWNWNLKRMNTIKLAPEDCNRYCRDNMMIGKTQAREY